MGYESDAKVVRGLSIATIVLSVLGILVAIALTACAGLLVSTAINAYTSDSSSIQRSVDPDGDFADSIEDVNQLFKVINDADIDDFELLLGNAKVKEINAFGKVVQTADRKSIKIALDAIDDRYGLDMDTDEMSKALTGIKPSATKAIGKELAEMDKDDVDGLLDVLVYIDGEDIDSLPDMIDTLSESPEAQAVQKLIAVVVSLVIFAMIGASVIALVAAVLSLRNCRKPEKLTGAFVWSIIAAVVSFCAGHWITMVLLIITCVYISKIRKYRSGLQGAQSEGPSAPDATESAFVGEPAPGPVPPQE